MSQFLIDAPLLACPSYDPINHVQSEENFINFLSRLADLEELRTSCESISFFRDDDLSLVLHDENCYPFRHSINEAFQNFNNSEDFQIEDVVTLATALLDRSDRLESIGQISDIVVSNCVIQHDPVSSRPPVFVDHLCRTIALAIPVIGSNGNFGPNTYVASQGLHSSIPVLIASYDIEMVETSDGVCQECDSSHAVSVPSYRGLLSLIAEADLVNWWSIATESAVLDAGAIASAVGHDDPLSQLKNTRSILSLNPSFISSAKKLGFMHDPTKISRLLRVCADLALGRDLGSSHWLRVNAGPSSSQKTRDSWRAWRHDIDYEFHLHYWREGRNIELANIVTHNDFHID